MDKPRIWFDGVQWLCGLGKNDWAQGVGSSPEAAYVEHRHHLAVY